MDQFREGKIRPVMGKGRGRGRGKDQIEPVNPDENSKGQGQSSSTIFHELFILTLLGCGSVEICFLFNLEYYTNVKHITNVFCMTKELG